MKKSVLILAGALIVVVAGLLTGLVLINGKMGSLQAELQAARNTVTEQQGLLSAANSEAADLRSQLNEVTGLLTETRASLDRTVSEKEGLALELSHYRDGFRNAQLQLDILNLDLRDAQEKILLMKDTFGDVSAGITPRDGLITDGVLENKQRFFRLERNPEANDPTWKQLLAFLKADRTDSISYVEDVYTCGNYAEDVFNHAHAAGIRSAVVNIFFEDEKEGHALNAFKTVDRGLVYIDCTGEPEGSVHPNMDSKVDLRIGYHYQRKFLFDTNYYFFPGNVVKSISIFW